MPPDRCPCSCGINPGAFQEVCLEHESEDPYVHVTALTMFGSKSSAGPRGWKVSRPIWREDHRYQDRVCLE